MGMIQNPTNLELVCADFGIKNYVETGVGKGLSMSYVLNISCIEKAYGIELDERLYTKYKFSNKVKIYNGYTHIELYNVLNDLDSNPTLFWFDAHFPGGDYFNEGYGKEMDVIKRLPLEQELNILSKNRDISNDVIFMDDLRIYVDRDFKGGVWHQRKEFGFEGYDFVNNLLKKTHIIKEHLGDEGYLLAFPINKVNKEGLIYLSK